MLDEYNTILDRAEAELVEKKSRFIATVSPAKTEEEARAFHCRNEKEILGCKDIMFLHIR